MHGAGLILGHRGVLITGPSGAGKSTAARLAGYDVLLSDDVCALTGVTSGPMIHGTPFGGATDGNRSAPLKAIFFPYKGKVFRITPLSPVLALKRYFEEHADYLRSLFKPQVSLMLKNAHALFRRVPSYELSFTLEGMDREAIKGVLHDSVMSRKEFLSSK